MSGLDSVHRRDLSPRVPRLGSPSLRSSLFASELASSDKKTVDDVVDVAIDEEDEFRRESLHQAHDIEHGSAGAIEKTNTRISVNDVSKIPNGGLRAWLQVVGSFFVLFNSWGLINTFGVYQTYYELELLSKSSHSAISWIGSIQTFLLMLVGALTGPVYDAGYFRALLWSGSFLIVFGHMALSLCTEYWQILLSQAFCIGLGSGLLFVPGVAILSTYFSTRIFVATGISASGSSLGGVIYPIMLNKLIPVVGFGWAVRIVGFVCLATTMISLLSMKVRVLPASKRSLVDVSALTDLPFMLFVLGLFVSFAGLYSMFFYVQGYAIAKDLTSKELSFYLLSVLNAGSVFGRVLPNMLAQQIGGMNCLVPSALVSGLLILALVAAHNAAALISIVALFGFCSGSFVSLPMTIVVSFTKDRGMIGTRLGMTFSFVGVAVLVGAPIDGAILDAKGYTETWIYGGVITIAGGMILLLSRGLFKGWKLNTFA